MRGQLLPRKVQVRRCELGCVVFFSHKLCCRGRCRCELGCVVMLSHKLCYRGRCRCAGVNWDVWPCCHKLYYRGRCRCAGVNWDVWSCCHTNYAVSLFARTYAFRNTCMRTQYMHTLYTHIHTHTHTHTETHTHSTSMHTHFSHPVGMF